MEAKLINYKLLVSLFFIINIFLMVIKTTRYYYIWFLLIIFLINIFVKIIFFILSLFNVDKEYCLENIKNINSNLPTYTILVALYKEDFNVIRNLINAIYNFDYDLDKLDIILLLEEDDIETIDSVISLNKLFKFNYTTVPKSNIKTKPNALNYGLKFAKGKYLVIYDAEDIPEPYQLKKSVFEFDKLPENYFCLQSRLNFYNDSENIITKCFSIEYALWFNYFTNTFSKYFNFFTIGGTSNHFKVDKLKQINGWDAYNVTEDAEISVRALKNNFKIKTLDSLTLEESVTDLKSWFKQRKRWIKGYIQTYLQYIIKPYVLYKKAGYKNFLLFNYIVGFSFLIPIFYLLFLIMYMFFLDDFSLEQIIINKFIYKTYILYTIISSFIFIKTHKYINYRNLFYILIFIGYSHLYTIVVYLSLIELIKQPFNWNKTTHNKSIYN